MLSELGLYAAKGPEGQTTLICDAMREYMAKTSVRGRKPRVQSMIILLMFYRNI